VRVRRSKSTKSRRAARAVASRRAPGIAAASGPAAGVTYRPLSPARWPDVERLFGERGACAGCWCMYWRLPARRYAAGQGEGNRRAFRRLVMDGAAHGVLAYADGEPVGWCAIGPRSSFPRLAGSRILAPVDDRPVWSVTCFFIGAGHRRRGLSAGLLDAAAGHAARHGARLLEGYPHDPRGAAMAAAFAWTGLAAAFTRAGFEECARRSPGRPIMRRTLPGR
jgi:GNAT superfamily N-acetyltransferase